MRAGKVVDNYVNGTISIIKTFIVLIILRISFKNIIILYFSKGSMIIMNFEKIGKKIAETRIRQNKTQEELAEILEISPSFLSHIETGKRKPGFDTLIQIAKCLNMSLDYLILDEDLEKNVKDEIYIKEIYKKMKLVDEETRKKLIEVIDIIIDISQKR